MHQKKHAEEHCKGPPQSFHSPRNAPQCQSFFSLCAMSALSHHVSLQVFLFLCNCGVCVAELWASSELQHSRTNGLWDGDLQTRYPHFLSKACSTWDVSSVASIQHKASQKKWANPLKQKQKTKFSFISYSKERKPLKTCSKIQNYYSLCGVLRTN